LSLNATVFRRVKFKWCSARKLFFEFHAPLSWKRDQIAGSLSLGKGRVTGKRHLRNTRGFHRAFVGTTPDLLEAWIYWQTSLRGSRLYHCSRKHRSPATAGIRPLRRTLSALNLVSIRIGGIIGAGVFVLTGHAAAKMPGPR
jgi:hypothetical protein